MENMMSVNLIDKENACRLVFEGSLTFEFARELEDNIINALRRYTQFELDLSGVCEIDICGIHLLGVLDAVAGKHVEVVDTSPIVKQAYGRLLAPGRGTWLRGSRAEHNLCNSAAAS
jgi:ABC-type transporter Mla MlaB component